jgi:hypothetical protein
MKITMRLSNILLSVYFFIGFFVSPAFAAPPPHASLDTFELFYRGEYFQSDTNLSDDKGDTDKLPFNQSYSNFGHRLEIGYTFQRPFRLALGGIYSFAQSKGVVEDRNNSKFNTLLLNSQYYAEFGKLLFVPDARIEFSTEDIEPLQDEVFTSEGSSHYQVGAWVKYPFWKLDNWLYLGYRMQEDDKADLLLLRLGTRWYLGSWHILGELSNQTPVVKDAFTDFPTVRTNVNTNVAGGSLRYNSVNPEYLEAELQLGYRIRQGMEVSGGLAHTVTGKNTAYGWTALVQFKMDYRLDDEPLDHANRISDTGNFMPEFESYDEGLFKK